MASNTKAVLITGGAQGIGKGIAQTFLENNINVVITDYDKAAGKQTEKELLKLGNIIFIPADVSDESDVKNIMRTINIEFKRLDCLINNAGIMIRKPSLESFFLKRRIRHLNY